MIVNTPFARTKRALITLAAVASAALLAAVACAPKDEIAPWEEGYLDIHAINTGRGECMYYVFPDGTTMLVDAAGSTLKQHKYMPTDARPDSTVSSGTVITRYIRHFAPEIAGNTVDYVVLSHYHSDHMGDFAPETPFHPDGFRLSGICEVGAELYFGTILTRGSAEEVWSPNMSKKEILDNFMNFVAWSENENGTELDWFKPGVDDQIVPKHKDIPGFKVQNIAASGYVWTGEGTQTATAIPPRATLEALDDPHAWPPENILSSVFILSYGDFDIFSGGDIQYKAPRTPGYDYSYLNIEAPISKVVKEVEVMKASHHCTSGTNSQEILDALKPQVVVANVWRDVQPNAKTLGRIYNTNPDCKVFLTNLAPKNEPVISEYLDRIASKGGHIMIRVAKGGRKYMVYTLDDGGFDYKVTGKWGPFKCK